MFADSPCRPTIAVRDKAQAIAFYRDVLGFKLVDAIYLWTFTGTHAVTGNTLRVAGWEEWDMDAEQRVTSSRGWFDADDYARQTASG
jgi:catechol 2,3-dioxygenase-like lactoylglutathione lyase family enzyme